MVTVVLFDYGVGNIHSLAKALEAGGATVRVESDPAALLRGDALVLPGVGAFGAAAEQVAPAAPALRRALADGFPCLGICLGMQLLFETSEEGPGAGLGILPGRVRRLRAPRVPHMGWNLVEPAASRVQPRIATRARSGDPAGSARREARGPEPRTARRARGGNAPPETTDPRGGLRTPANGPPASIGAASETEGLPGGTPAGTAPAGRVDPLLAGTIPLVAYYANSFVAEPAEPGHVIAWTDYEGDRFPAAVRFRRAWGVQFHPEKSGSPGLRLLRNFLAEVAG